MSGETGRDLATIVANVSADLFKDGTKISATVTKEILLALLKNAKKRNEFKSGKVNLKKLVNSGQEVKRVTIKDSDLKDFSKKAKKFGIAFTVVGEKNNPDKAILFKAGDMELMKKVLEDIIDKKIEIKEAPNKEVTSKESKIINNEDKVLNDFSLKLKEFENQEKFYLVDNENKNKFAEIKNQENFSEISVFDNLAKKESFRIEKQIAEKEENENEKEETKTDKHLLDKIEEIGFIGATVMTEKEFKDRLNSLEIDSAIDKTTYYKSNVESEKEKPSVREHLKEIHNENTIKREQAKEEKSHDKTKKRELDR